MQVAEPLLKHLGFAVSTCKAEFASFTHTGIQHEHKVGEVYTHQLTYVDAIKPIATNLYSGQVDGKPIADTPLHEAVRSCLGAVAWAVLSRPDVVVYVQALQRRGASPMIIYVKRCNLVMRYLRRYKCGIKAICIQHPLNITGFTDAAFKALGVE